MVRELEYLIFQMPVGRLNEIMTHNNQWESAGLGITGETYLVGTDKKITFSKSIIIGK